MFDDVPAPVALAELSDAALVDAVGELARAENAVCARKLAAMAELFCRRTGLDSATERQDWWLDPEGAVSVELGAALGTSRGLALAQAHRGVALRDRLPKVAELFADGAITDVLVRAIVWRTHLVEDPAALAAVDEELAARVRRWGALTVTKTEQAIDAIVLDHDAGALRRSAAAARTRDVQFGSPVDEPGFTSLWARLYAHDGALLEQRLNEMVGSVCADDPRTMAERRADAMGVLGTAKNLACGCGNAACPAGQPADTPANIVVNVVISDSTLPAASAAEPRKCTPPPAFVMGGAIMPAPLLAATLGRARVREIRHPGDTPPEPRYLASPVLANFVRCRDLTCRFPGCDKPAQYCDTDHTVPHPLGPTHASNLKCLCRHHFPLAEVHLSPMETMTKPLVRAGCYHRISSDPKDKREGVDRQREDTAALCEIKEWTVAGDYTDDDRSASNGKKRERWNDLLDDIKAGKIDAIAAWDQDRNWRMMHELEDLRRFFASLGREVKLATTGQGEIDLNSPTGVLMAQIKTAVSEHEIAMMRIRQKRAARQKAEQGKPKWKQAFGYLPDTRPKELDDGIRKIDKEQQKLVKAAYTAIVKRDKKISHIAEEWNVANVHGLNGQPWSPSTVSLFLRSPRNAALRSHNDELVLDKDGQPVKGTWPPLVDEKLWRAAQRKLNAPGRAPGPKSVRKHLLTGVLLCGKRGCGGHLSGNWVTQAQKTGPRAYALTYACKQCRGVSIRAEHIEPLLYRLVGGRLAMPDAVDLLKSEIHDEVQAEAIRLELVTLYDELAKIGVERGQRLLTGQQAKIATDLINGDIAKLQRRQQDQEKLRVFEDIPLGTPEAVAVVEKLSPDRFRAVVGVLMAPTVLPVGKGGHAFDPQRLKPNWHAN